MNANASARGHRTSPPLMTEHVLAEEALAIAPKPPNLDGSLEAKRKELADAERKTLPDAELKKLKEQLKALQERKDAYGEIEQAVTRAPPSERGQKLGVGTFDAAECEATSQRQRPFYRALNNLDRAALCLSGGGIRSAAFSLGVIQALATHPRPEQPRALFDTLTEPEPGQARTVPDERKPENTARDAGSSLLAQLQFLSTVSGGGYIGSWLSVWRERADFATLWSNLVGRPCGPDVEPGTIAWLRAYSNYLTPKLGALSGDTWAGVAITVRNLLLNWLVIVPAVCMVILLLKMIATVSIGVAVYPESKWMGLLFGVLALAPFIAALSFTTRHRPTRRADNTRDAAGRRGIRQGTFIRLALIPATLAAGAVIQFGASNTGLALVGDHSNWFVIALCALGGAVVYAIGWIAACPHNWEKLDLLAWTMSGLVYGTLLGAGVYLYNLAPTEGFWLFNDLLLPMMLGVPWILLSQMIAEVIFVGLSSYQTNSDSDREWLGRAAGWYLVMALGWLVVTFLIFAGSLAVDDFANHLKNWIAPLGGIGGVVTAVVGKSSWSEGPGQQAKGAKPLPTRIILGIAAPLFGAALIIFLSAALDAVLINDSLVILLRDQYRYIFEPDQLTLAGPLLFGLVITGVAAWLASKFADIKQLVVLAVALPIVATVVTLALASHKPFGPLPYPLWELSPRAMRASGSWEITAPLLLGAAIAGVMAWAAAKRRHIDIRKPWVLIIAGPVVAAVFIIFLSSVLDMLAETAGFPLKHRGLGIFAPGWFGLFAPLVVGFVACGLIAWIASRNININRFSLHAIYRNRLVRAFLGASRPRRNPDAFSGFDPDDNPPMHELWPRPQQDGTWLPRPRSEWRPFHVINMALNVVSTHRLSWQERKAESFTVSPLHSGSPCKAFRRSDEYAGAKGISLGTAMAISGAAASSNMGYNSSPAVTFLMALFNVRLGWWLGNPGKEGHASYRKEGPALALQPLVEETFGLTTDERPYIYLSDGGHFENLGIYEMVRRRCRHIVAVDAGADPDYGFEDLGNAVRKIAIDLGVTIRLHGLADLKKRDPEQPDIGPHQPYHVVGEIDYPAADGGGKLGTILYIKPGYHGVEDAGVRAYAIANPTFPHQGTIDQFFSESQFESYRSLGFEIADHILNKALKKIEEHHGRRTDITLDDIFRHLREETKKASEKALKAASAPPSEPAHPAPLTDGREGRPAAG